jgi:hypothetical protein
MPKSIASGNLTRRPIATPFESTTLICFSHLRWDFVYQRPQHLMSRFARHSRVFYVEEPIYGADMPRLELSRRDNNLTVVVPSLPHNLSEQARDDALRSLLADFVGEQAIASFVAWYYTPMALPWTNQLHPVAIVYDCMDELSLFRGAPAEMVKREQELIALADVVFTGGTSLYEAKRSKSDNVHCFPSSVDAEHFRQARTLAGDPADQAEIPRLRLGFAGVIDERMDLELLSALADARPEWHLVLVGPVVKISLSSRSRSTSRPASSARPRRRSISLQGCRWCRRRFAMWSRRTAWPISRESDARRRNSSMRSRPSSCERRRSVASGSSASTASCPRCHGTEHTSR